MANHFYKKKKKNPDCVSLSLSLSPRLLYYIFICIVVYHARRTVTRGLCTKKYQIKNTCFFFFFLFCIYTHSREQCVRG